VSGSLFEHFAIQDLQFLERLVIQHGMNIQSEIAPQILCQFLEQILSPSNFPSWFLWLFGSFSFVSCSSISRPFSLRFL
jgi:hypothetical protein